MNSPADHNPYEPPDLTAKPAIESSRQPLRTVVQRFRKASRVLAGIAIFLACLAGLDTFWPRSGVPAKIHHEILELPEIVVSTVLFGLGVQVARKKMWAVRVLMIVAYAALGLIAALWVITFGARFTAFAVIPAAVFGFVVVQCHRVIGHARTMTAAGIPLNVKPHQVNLNRPAPVYTPRGHE